MRFRMFFAIAMVGTVAHFLALLLSVAIAMNKIEGGPTAYRIANAAAQVLGRPLWLWSNAPRWSMIGGGFSLCLANSLVWGVGATAAIAAGRFVLRR